MSKVALITGVTGFAGKHLAELLIQQGYKVIGIDIDVEETPRAPKSTDKPLTIISADLRNEEKISELFSKYTFDLVFHLAAQSSVKLSFENPQETFSINVNGTLNILEVISRIKKPPRTLIISSSEIYGQLTPDEVPVAESAPLKPVNPYAVTKAAVDLLAYQYQKAYNLPIYLARAFSHSGPGQRTVAVLSDWAFQTAKIELKLRQPEILVGNMDVIRDYTDVRDTVRAYYMIVTGDKPGCPYNVCSGIGYRLTDLLKIITDFSSQEIKITPDPSRLRPVDIPILIGSPARLKADTGWRPEIDIKKTLRDLYDYWIAYLTPQIERN